MTTLRRLGAAVALLLTAACAGDRASPVALREGTATLPNGARLWYGIMGGGPDTIVVVPGGPMMSHAYLTAAVRPLARRHAVVLYDLRGRGLSDSVPADAPGVSVGTDAADLLALLDTLGIGKAGIVAHHYGSAVVLSLAQRHADRLGRVAFVAPYLLSDLAQYDLASEPMDSVAVQALAADFRDGLHERDPDSYCRRHWPVQFGPVEDMRAHVVRALADSACAGRRQLPGLPSPVTGSILTSFGPAWNFVDSSGALRAPLLVLQGTTDPIYLFWSRIYAARASEGRMLELPGSATFPWIDAPAAFGRALDRFFAGEWPPGAVRPPLELRRPPVDSIRPLAP